MASQEWETESNESVFERCCIGDTDLGIRCGMIGWVKCSTLKWFRHVEMIPGEEFTKRENQSIIEERGVRERPQLAG